MISDIWLEISIDAQLNKDEDSEYIGLHKITAKMFIADKATYEPREIGFIEFFEADLLNNHAYDCLDSAIETADFTGLFNEQNELDDKIIQTIGKKWKTSDIFLSDVSTMLVISRVFIETDYRGNGLFKVLFDRSLSLLRFDIQEILIVLKSFPLQHENKNSDKVKQKIDSKKLLGFYEELGFLKLKNCKEGHLMCFLSDMILKDTNQQ